jgi:homoserine O-succinyltransferase/O-acetyltransferase
MYRTSSRISIKRLGKDVSTGRRGDFTVPEDLTKAQRPCAGRSRAEPRYNGGGDRLTIGLVNNMPDTALHATERQFRRLIAAAADDIPVRLRLFYLPEVPRSDRGRTYLEKHYDDIGELWASRLDGLIVTGTEPRASDLRDEPYWTVLTRLVDWADCCTNSTVWSCLAAHAAVLHTDGITRRALPAKLFGLFDCRKVSDHGMVRGTARRWRIAHSRRNDVPAAALAARGYRLLSWSPEAGADMFVKQKQSLFVYFQGHPEYDPDTLAREYRRDVGRFLAGENNCYPAMPRGYFSELAATALNSLQQRALRERSLELLSSYPAAALEPSTAPSSDVAIGIYRRWLAFIAANKDRRSGAFSAEPPQRSVGGSG